MAFEQVRLISPDGQEFGPVDYGTLREWVQQCRVPPGATLIDMATGERQPALALFPDLGQLRPAPDETVATIIPYRNVPALISYYLGVFSFIACVPFVGFLGIPMAIAALVLGVKGLHLANVNPAAKGKVHAWIGILGGGLCMILGLIINGMVIVGIASGKFRQ